MRKIIKSDTGWRVSGVRSIFFPEMTDTEKKTVFLLSEESGEKTPKGVLRFIEERGLVCPVEKRFLEECVRSGYGEHELVESVMRRDLFVDFHDGRFLAFDLRVLPYEFIFDFRGMYRERLRGFISGAEQVILKKSCRKLSCERKCLRECFPKALRKKFRGDLFFCSEENPDMRNGITVFIRKESEDVTL